MTQVLPDKIHKFFIKTLVILKMEQILTGNTNTLALFCNHKKIQKGVAYIKSSHLSAIQSYLGSFQL